MAIMLVGAVCLCCYLFCMVAKYKVTALALLHCFTEKVGAKMPGDNEIKDSMKFVVSRMVNDIFKNKSNLK